jgi:hypothetical protein
MLLSGCIALYEAAAPADAAARQNWAVVNYAHIHHIKITPLGLHELSENIALFYRQAKRLPSITFEVASWSRIAGMHGVIHRDVLKPV